MRGVTEGNRTPVCRATTCRLNHSATVTTTAGFGRTGNPSVATRKVCPDKGQTSCLAAPLCLPFHHGGSCDPPAGLEPSKPLRAGDFQM